MAAKKKGKQNYKTYDIYCAKCQTYVLQYHKYGSGNSILRLYMAHIVAPEKWANLLEQNYAQIKAVPNLICGNEDCKELLGVPALSKSNRWVFRMKQGYFHRKLTK